MAGSSWPALVAGTKARASDVEAKFDWVEGSIVPMTGGNTTDGTYDLGTVSARWRHGYFSSIVYMPSLGLSTTAITFDAAGTATANVAFKLATGVAVTKFSNDGSLAGNSDLNVPTEKAVKTYVDAAVGASSYIVTCMNSPDITLNGTSQYLSMTSVLDISSEFSASAFNPNTNGTYEIRGQVYFAYGNNTTTAGYGIFNVELYRNSSTACIFQTSAFISGTLASQYIQCNFCTILSVTSSDNVRLAALGYPSSAGGFCTMQGGFGNTTLPILVITKIA